MNLQKNVKEDNCQKKFTKRFTVRKKKEKKTHLGHLKWDFIFPLPHQKCISRTGPSCMAKMLMDFKPRVILESNYKGT